MKPTYFPGTRVKVFDSTLFVNDVATPLSHTMRPATVVCWYSKITPMQEMYDGMVDVLFDHRPGKVSRGHFTYRMTNLASEDEDVLP